MQIAPERKGERGVVAPSTTYDLTITEDIKRASKK